MLEPLYTPITFKSMASLQKVATKTLSNNSAEWTKQIIEYFFDRYPQAMNQPVFVQFKDRNPEKGYAIGSLRMGSFLTCNHKEFCISAI